MNSGDFIKTRLREHYERHPVKQPREIEKREFGFGDIKKIDYRHMAFTNERDLNRFVLDKLPLYASFSTAYYEFPAGRPMERKNFRGADLLFEFDTECGSPEHNSIMCPKCLNKAKEDTIRLVEDFLVPDFGFAKTDMRISFSGNRGYHIYIESDAVRGLSAQARRELTDYIQGKGVDVKKLIEKKDFPVIAWRKRLLGVALPYIETSGRKELSTPEKREYAKQQMLRGNFDVIKGNEAFFEKALEKQKVEISADVDQNVTFDIARLIRLPTTIHSGSSLLCDYVTNLGAFDPWKHVVVFGDKPFSVTFSEDVPYFELKDRSFGPFPKGYKTELPEFAAMLLACRGKLALVD